MGGLKCTRIKEPPLSQPVKIKNLSVNRGWGAGAPERPRLDQDSRAVIRISNSLANFHCARNGRHVCNCHARLSVTGLLLRRWLDSSRPPPAVSPYYNETPCDTAARKIEFFRFTTGPRYVSNEIPPRETTPLPLISLTDANRLACTVTGHLIHFNRSLVIPLIDPPDWVCCVRFPVPIVSKYPLFSGRDTRAN